jgi:hypothetical protein
VSTARRLRILSGPEFTEGLRNRRQLVVRAVTPLLALSAVFAFTQERERLAGDAYQIAVQGDIAGAGETLTALAQAPTLQGSDTPPLEFTPTDSAAVAVAGSADAGLVLPDGLDDALASGATATIDVYTDAAERPSRAAAALLRAALFEHLAPLPGEVGLAIVGVTSTDEDTDGVGQARDDLGRVVAAYVLLQGAVLVGTAAVRLTGRRATGNLVPQLLLPVPRFELLTSRGLTELGLGMLTGLPMLGLVALTAVLILIADGATATAALTLVMIPLTAAAIAVPLICAGLTIGIRARSAQQVSGLTAASLVVVSVAARFVSGIGDEPARYLAAVPLVGPSYILRETIAGRFDPLGLIVALVSTLVLGWIVLRAAAHLMGGEHLALRSA